LVDSSRSITRATGEPKALAGNVGESLMVGLLAARLDEVGSHCTGTWRSPNQIEVLAVPKGGSMRKRPAWGGASG
jgi:hypothetical protein